MPVVENAQSGWMYGRNRIYRTPVGSAGGPKNMYFQYKQIWPTELNQFLLSFSSNYSQLENIHSLIGSKEYNINDTKS